MSAPERLRDGAGGASRLLRGASAPRKMSDEQRARSRGRVQALAALPVIAGTTLWVKGVVLAAGLSVAGASVAIATHMFTAPGVAMPRLESPLPVHALTFTQVEASSVSAPIEVAPVIGAVTPPAATGSPPRPRVVPSITRTPEEALAAEVALIEEARALVRSNPRGALAKADAHAREFPSGQLSVERELVAVDALTALHRYSEARTRGAPLLNGIYGERVKRILDSIP